MPNDIQIEIKESTQSGGYYRVCAEVANDTVWFESQDVPLSSRPEVFASAFLLPALANRRRLSCRTALCPLWLHNLAGVVELAHEWWGYTPIAGPFTPAADVVAADSSRKRHAALCFSNGIDSFFSLLRADRRPDWLVTVEGFDVRLGDTHRFAGMQDSTRSVASELGLKHIFIRTNLREHTLFAKADWRISHGGALAAVGHLLSDHVEQLTISSSVWKENDKPWGSHELLDPLWSSSDLDVQHFGAAYSRRDKVMSIAQESVLYRNLRVCWESRFAQANCSKCDKCICTMVLLQVANCLDRFVVFNPPASLAELLDSLPKTAYVKTYESILAGPLHMRERSAIESLLRRTDLWSRRRYWGTAIRRCLAKAAGLLQPSANCGIQLQSTQSGNEENEVYRSVS